MNVNGAGSAAWSSAEEFDPMAGASVEHDFGSLIDFDHLDLDFSVDYSAPNAHDTATQQLNQLSESLDVQHLQTQFSPAISQEHRDGAGALPHQQDSMGGHGIPQVGNNNSNNNNNYYDFDMSSYSQAGAASFSQAQDHMYRPHAGVVPPTPNSIEMHGDPGRYLQMDPQQALFDQRYQLRKDDATFTPLVSPAVTPHEAQFRMQEFTGVPSAYFSPLTSPALTAQQHQQAHGYPGQYNTLGSCSTGTSPIDVDMDLLGEAAIPQQEHGKKLRSNKRSAPRSSNATGRMRQSPIVKPGRRKATVTSLVPPKEVSELVDEAQESRSSMLLPLNGLDVPRGHDGSETGSISPEPLSDMGPPPKPFSLTHSPAMKTQPKQSIQGIAPATPASLMRIHPSPNFGAAPEMPPLLEDLALPEATWEKTHADAIEEEDQDTPRLTARKTPKLAPLSTPSAGAALCGKPSPMLNTISSPSSPAFSVTSKKRSDPKLDRNSKKRNSIAPSTLASPALRPRISPSIKPLLPDSSLSDDTHALLLASKSNYQNILDGTTVPGVVYPTSLSTNLTSKRTSHKIAEQGRRNRINTALQEMQALIPSPHLAARDAKSPDSSSTAAQLSNSKAAKVESAIDYIRTLKQQCSEKDKLLDQKDQEMDALRKELATLKRSSSTVSSLNVGEADVQMTTEADSSPSTHSENATQG
ncbi:hypothetical protein K504DRAFT_390977 [Pleomassaria siparia CBS 279.74]|uniref:BHLH domain-containing protein n=1 Tax=Pleomassaria siparia CBS 279.74 TaxID=1314801 RepID=A0A6G1JTZ5_9PLEO|nr:hypothetical protein K504DRAFT_390977 [Pleomassaria siparia CBS 279.74]